METNKQYIMFVFVENKTRTSVWNVVNKASGVVLGKIKWYANWRRYCYFPTASYAVYSAGCLADIHNFIQQQMKARKEKRQAELKTTDPENGAERN